MSGGGRIVGHVDGVGENGITGWIADLDHPASLEPIRCVGANGSAVVFKACHFREDVRFWLQVEGRFGFAIPVSALAGLGASVTLLDRHGGVLPNGASVALPPTSPASDGTVREPIVLLHIPKTAGTSLRNAAFAAIRPGERLFLYPGLFGLAVAELAALPPAQRDAAWVVCGHTSFGIDRFLGRRARYVTVLRETADRLRSHVGHHASAGTEFGLEGLRLPLAVVVNEGLHAEFDNLTVRMIAGLDTQTAPLGTIDENHVALAVSNIERHFALVGTVQTLDEDARHLAALLGRPGTRPAVENVGGRSMAGVEGPSRRIDWDHVCRRNRFDTLLYEHVIARQKRRATRVRLAG